MVFYQRAAQKPLLIFHDKLKKILAPLETLDKKNGGLSVFQSAEVHKAFVINFSLSLIHSQTINSLLPEDTNCLPDGSNTTCSTPQ